MGPDIYRTRYIYVSAAMPIIKPSDDHYYHPDYTDDNGDEDIYDMHLDFLQWQEWYQQDLMNMWMGMRGYCDNSYLRGTLMGGMEYNDFCEFVYYFSTQASSRHAT
jgi:hypothetical protein